MRREVVDDDTALGKLYDAALVRRLAQYVKPYRHLVGLAIVLMLGSTAVDLSVPYITKVGIDRYLAQLFYPFEASPEVCDSLAQASTEVRRAARGVVFIRASWFNRLDARQRAELRAKGTLGEKPLYVFESSQARPGIGEVRGPWWVVPEAQLSRVPPRTLLALRGDDARGIARIALVLVAFILVGSAAHYGHVYVLQVAGQRAMLDLRRALFGHMERLSLPFFDRNPVGRLVTRVTNDVEALNEMFTTVLVSLAKDVILVVGTLVIIFSMNTRLALVAVAVAPAFTVTSFLFRVKARAAFREVRRILASLNATLAEDLSGIKVVQAFRREAERSAHFASLNEQYYGANIRQLVVFGVFRPLIEFIATVGVALVLVVGGITVAGAGLSLGALVAFLNYVRQMFEPLSDLSEKYHIMQSAMASAERIFAVMDEEPLVKEPARPRRIQVRGRVAFEHVWFSYVPGQPVLRDVSFVVEPGRSLAIVGPTGAGKTSIINLVCRFYDPQGGRVTLDGVDLRELPLWLLRQHVAVVLQDSFVFSRTVEENIRLGRPLPRPQVEQAAAVAQAKFVFGLEQGFDTVMAERGATLSTGQKQLLCFARALAGDPTIILLDEATSNVDPATELLIQQAIETLMRGRTSIVVAHRLSTVQRADEILVLEAGRIVERGTHQQLMDRGGLYHRLYVLQYLHGVKVGAGA